MKIFFRTILYSFVFFDDEKTSVFKCLFCPWHCVTFSRDFLRLQPKKINGVRCVESALPTDLKSFKSTYKFWLEMIFKIYFRKFSDFFENLKISEKTMNIEKSQNFEIFKKFKNVGFFWVPRNPSSPAYCSKVWDLFRGPLSNSASISHLKPMMLPFGKSPAKRPQTTHERKSFCERGAVD